MKRENELLRQRLSKLEKTQISSNSSVISSESKISSDDHRQQHDNNLDNLDDLQSNISLHSVSSSSILHETILNDQPKYFDRKRRLLAGEQQISTSETEISLKKDLVHIKKLV